MTTRIVHISDTHFGTEVPEVVEAIKRSIAANAPDVVVLSGDVTQRARKRQFADAKAFMASLPPSVHLVVPGNHDIPLYNLFARFVMPYRNYQRFFGARENIWQSGEVGIVAYDATYVLRHTRGRVSDKQLLDGMERLKEHLPRGAVIIAVAHQPLVTRVVDDTDEQLIHRRQTARLWAEHGVDIVLSGHVHMPILATTDHSFTDLPRNFILAGAGTAVSHRIRPGAPNSYNSIVIENGQICIKAYVFNKNTGEFTGEPETCFIRQANGWAKAI